MSDDREQIGAEERERARIATHEAGHAYAGYRLPGAKICGPVSIEPGKTYNGIAFVRGPRVRPQDLDRISLVGVVGELAKVRRAIETEAIICLAGPAAERWRFGLCANGNTAMIRELRERRGKGEEHKPVVPAPGKRTLPTREARLLASAASAERIDDDLFQAESVVKSLFGGDPDRTDPYLAVLFGEARALLAKPEAKRMVRKLAEALLDRTTLSSYEAREILKANDPTTGGTTTP